MWLTVAKDSLRQSVRSFGYLTLLLAAFSATYAMVAFPSSFYLGLAARPLAPINIVLLTSLVTCYLSVFLIPFLAGPLLRDWELRTSPLLLTTFLKPSHYVFGRCFGAFLIALLTILVASAGGILATLIVSSGDLAGWQAGILAWAFALIVFGIPNAAVLAGLFVSSAAHWRNARSVYVVAALLLVYLLATLVVGRSSLGLLLDPFGTRVLAQEFLSAHSREASEYAFPELSGMLIGNRLVWIAATVGLVAVVAMRMSSTITRAFRQGVVTTKHPRALPSFGNTSSAFSATVASNLRFLLRNSATWAFVSLAGLILFSSLVEAGDPQAIPELPGLEWLLLAIGGNFRTMLALLVIVLSGEIVWRDRALRTADAVLSARSGTLQRLLAQIVALWICTLLFFSLGVAFAGSWSLAFGGTLVPLDFLAGTLSMLTPPLLLAAAALGLQYATGNKYFGTALSLLVLATHFLMLEKVPVSPFLRAGILPSRSYSDLVGFGPSWGVWSLYALYWAAACAFVVFGGAWMAARRPSDLSASWERERILRRSTFAVVISLLVASGCLISALHGDRYADPGREAARQAEAIAAYQSDRATGSEVALSVEDARLFLVLDAESREVVVRGNLRLKNSGPSPISLVKLSTSAALSWLEASAGSHNVRLGPLSTGTLLLPTPLLAGQSVVIGFRSKVEESTWTRSPRLTRGFAFLGSDMFMPCIGPNPTLEAVDARREVEATVSGSVLGCGWGSSTMHAELTGPSRLRAIGSGSPIGRRSSGSIAVTSFESKEPVAALWGFGWGQWVSQSARTPTTRVEVLSVPGHAASAGRLLESATESIKYFSESLAPYPFPTLTLVEVPRWNGPPISYPGLVAIPESAGFNADYDGVRPVFGIPAMRFDRGSWVVAHEIAHQWWGHQVLPARTPGSQFLTETLAEFGAYRVAQQRPAFDASAARQRARATFLTARRSAKSAEPALSSVQSEPYVAYAKGMLVMSELQRLLGEAQLDALLGSWFDAQNAGAAGPAVADTLIEAIIEATPQERQSYVQSLLLDTTLPSVSITASGTTRDVDGAWHTRLCLDAKLGRATSVPIDVELQQIDSSHRNAAPVVVARSQVWLSHGGNTVDILSKGRPATAEVDPQMWLVDDRQGRIRATTPLRTPLESCAR